MSAETQGSDYLIIKSTTTLTAGTDFPIDRRLVIDLVGGGGGGNSGGNGYAYNYTVSGGVWDADVSFGINGLGGKNGEHRTYTFEKNSFSMGETITFNIGVGGIGGVHLGYIPRPHNDVRYPADQENVNLYGNGAIGTSGTSTAMYRNGIFQHEASGGESVQIIQQLRTKNVRAVYNSFACNGTNGWNTSIPFSVSDSTPYIGGLGGDGGEAVGAVADRIVRGTGKNGTSSVLGSGGGGGGGGGIFLYAGSSDGYFGGNGGNGGNGFASIRWGSFGGESYNKEIFQPNFFNYSPDIGECFYAHTQQKMLSISSYKNAFISTMEGAIKATNGNNLYITINGRQCYLPFGDFGTAIMNGGTNAQSVSDFLTNLGYESLDIESFGTITARPDVSGIRADLSSSPSFRQNDLQFIADEMYDYFTTNGITKISISHKENMYNFNSISQPTSGLSLLDSEVTATTTTVGQIKYTQYQEYGKYCYSPESYYYELNNLVFKKEDNTIVSVHDSIRKASLAMILLSANNFVTPIGIPVVESVVGFDIERNVMTVREDFRISIIPYFGTIEFSRYALGQQLDTDQTKKEDMLNYMIDGKVYKNLFCNLVWSSRDYFLEYSGSGILQHLNGNVYIDVLRIRDEDIQDTLYTLSQTLNMTVIEEKQESFWKSLLSGIMSIVIFVVSAYFGQILKLPSVVISTALSFAWSKIMPPPEISFDMNGVGTFSISKRNDENEDDDTSTSVDFFGIEDEERKNMYNPYIEVRKMNESQYKPYGKGGMMWQQS